MNRASARCLGLLLVAAPQLVLAEPRVPAGKVQVPRAQLTGAWFGQPAPGETPRPFAPEILRELSPWIAGVAFSPDGTQCFLSAGTADYSGSRSYLSTRVKDVWTSFVEVPFGSDFTSTHEFTFSPDGKTVTFTGKKEPGSWDFWAVSQSGKGWNTPARLPAPLNSDDDEFRGSATADGTLYFGRAHARLNQVHKAFRNADRELVVELLGPPINTQSYEGDPCVAPDGHFMVFYSGRVGGQGGTDLYVSFTDGKGGWGTPVNLGTAFNGPYDEWGAHLSADGRYLFFTRHTPTGSGVYWVAASAIDKLRP